MIFHPLVHFLLLFSLALAFGHPTGLESAEEETATSPLPVAGHSSEPEITEEKEDTRPPLPVADHSPKPEKTEESTEERDEECDDECSAEVTQKPATTLPPGESKRLVKFTM